MSTTRVLATCIALGVALAVAYYLGGEQRIAAYGAVWAICLDEAERQLVQGRP